MNVLWAMLYVFNVLGWIGVAIVVFIVFDLGVLAGIWFAKWVGGET